MSEKEFKEYTDKMILGLLEKANDEEKAFLKELIYVCNTKCEVVDKAVKYIKDRMIIEHSFMLDRIQCNELLKILDGE